MSVPSPGDVVAGYRVEATLARGGMGVVYTARQLTLDRLVALKVILPQWSADDAFRAQFAREARMAAAIEHPHVVPIYEAGEADGQLFVSMRYIDGPDLAELLAPGPLGVDDAVRIVAQVAGALDA